MIRELGPVLTGIMVSGRNASSMASELGSMVVTEQIDAMRALGVDPMRKLVTPRVYRHRRHAVLPHHRVGLRAASLGGAVVTVFMNHQNGTQYFSQAYEFLALPGHLPGPGEAAVFGIHHRQSSGASMACGPPAEPRAWAAPPFRPW